MVQQTRQQPSQLATNEAKDHLAKAGGTDEENPEEGEAFFIIAQFLKPKDCAHTYCSK